MRIHTSTLEFLDIHEAMQMAGVFATTCELKGSRRRNRAFEIKLSGDSPFRQNGGTEYAATWDQWGIFLADLYSRDPNMIAAYYDKTSFVELQSSKDIFEYATGHRFDELTLARSHRRHKWNPQGNYTSHCNCGAVQRWDHLTGELTSVAAQPKSERIVRPRPLLPLQPVSQDASVQLWDNDEDREWFNNMAQRARARRA